MKTIIKAVSVIALMTMLSGCIVAPGHHDSGWHGGGGGYGHSHGGGHHRGW
ncbi:hypothetical protein J2125_000936 [Erwinia toletana]|uniref:Lipoprotein n=1 Tax=Winslowiella toletana TaxID=92490 RepID=A0ABS4P526_9GAMM|nr:hypothetical protein [Winslowiella toletana]MBP2167744.1 hypothetical protein [Winslowiella toletana]